MLKSQFLLGGKNDAIAAVEDLLTRETQWYDYMEEVICFITTNFDEDEPAVRVVMTHSTESFTTCDIFLPQWSTVYVYMLVSIKYLNFSYIGKICRFEIYFNKMILALYPYQHNHDISDLMLYFIKQLGLIQKWFIVLHWKTRERKNIQINKKWC